MNQVPVDREDIQEIITIHPRWMTRWGISLVAIIVTVCGIFFKYSSFRRDFEVKISVVNSGRIFNYFLIDMSQAGRSVRRGEKIVVSFSDPTKKNNYLILGNVEDIICEPGVCHLKMNTQIEKFDYDLGVDPFNAVLTIKEQTLYDWLFGTIQ